MNEMPERIWVERDDETDAKRWYSIKGMGVEYIRADLATRSSDAVAGREPVARARVYMWKDRRQFSVNELGTKAAGELPVGVYDLYAAPPELDQLRDRVKELEKALDAAASALDEAVEDVRHWGGYAGTYFQGKHGLEDDLDRISKQANSAHRVREGGQA